MKKLNEASLNVGDIILTTTTEFISKTIQTVTKSDISHAMVYVEEYSVIDATAEGVQARNTQRLYFEDNCAVYALRYKGGLSAEQSTKICRFVRTRVGTQYSKVEAFKTVLTGKHQWNEKQFCSRLVAQAYNSAGLDIVDDKNFCSPANIKKSAVLDDVQAAIKTVSTEEWMFWEGREDLPQMMRDATNLILDGLRKKNRSIQNFDDLNQFLIEHPHEDSYVCELLETSGYLTLWEIEKKKNPWQYDIILMHNFSANQSNVESYCLTALSNEQGDINRFVLNRGGYASLYDRFGLRAFKLMKDLYQRLSELHQRRFEVASEWLNANDLGETPEERCLLPHSLDWFNALETWEPRQALMTKAAIRAAGHVQICSICGDEPANDYRLKLGARLPGGVDTYRLCNFCLKIRRQAGEPFIGI